MRIQELERLVDIERATIRFYEKEGLITPVRSENGYRDYSEEDAAELKRIKLLRELGVGLDTIRNLQTGKEDFSEVMRRQVTILQGRRDQMERARIVCERISCDGAAYGTLDTDQYRSLLNAPLLPGTRRQGSGTFQEREYRTPHPWRRYFARILDHDIITTTVWFLIVVVLRWRPAGDVGNAFVAYIGWLLLMPLEALCLHFWGCTPGKWLMGIRVEAAEGGKLSFDDALRRAWLVFRHGMFLGIPLVNLYCMYRGYKDHNENWDTMWDEDCEVTFREGFCWKNTMAYILAFAVGVGINVVCELDAELPAHRGNELTVAQFASNYNFYDYSLLNNLGEHMDRKGILELPEHTQSMVMSDGSQVKYSPYAQFEFELEGDAIQAITFHHTWYDRDAFLYNLETGKEVLGYWIPGYCRVAALTAVLSQDAGHQQIAGYVEQLQADMVGAAPNGHSADYGAVRISWTLELELFKEDPNSADIYKVTLDMKIEYP